MIDRRASAGCESAVPKVARYEFGSLSLQIRGGLNRYAITGADIVQQEVAVGMDGSVGQRVRNRERAAVDRRSRGCCDNGSNVTNIATYLVKFLFTEVRIRRDRTTGRGLGRSHKVGECLNIDAIVFRFVHGVIDRAKSDELALRRIFIRKERTGDAHSLR